MTNLFISEAYVKDNSVITLNVDAKFIRAAVNDAQVIHIQEAIGSRLFKKIDSLLPTAINTAGNANYKNLLDTYIAPALLQWTVVECIPNLRFKMTNKSVTADSSDNSNPTDLTETRYLTDKITNKAEFYTQRLIEHIKNNTNIYPEYYQATPEELSPVKSAYFSGSYIPDEHDCCRNNIIRKTW